MPRKALFFMILVTKPYLKEENATNAKPFGHGEYEDEWLLFHTNRQNDDVFYEHVIRMTTFSRKKNHSDDFFTKR